MYKVILALIMCFCAVSLNAKEKENVVAEKPLVDRTEKDKVIKFIEKSLKTIHKEIKEEHYFHETFLRIGREMAYNDVLFFLVEEIDGEDIDTCVLVEFVNKQISSLRADPNDDIWARYIRNGKSLAYGDVMWFSQYQLD